MSKRNFFYRNSLSIVLFIFMIICLLGQFLTGWKTENKELAENGKSLLSIAEYIHSGHFIQATFENWQSEFLAVFSLVVLSIWLREKGSPESKPVDAAHDENA